MIGSKAAIGTEEGLEKAAKPRPGKVCGYSEGGVVVVGGAVKGISEVGGDGQVVWPVWRGMRCISLWL